MEPSHRSIDLSRETLKLEVCSACRAIVLPEDFEGHQAWHRRLMAREER